MSIDQRLEKLFTEEIQTIIRDHIREGGGYLKLKDNLSEKQIHITADDFAVMLRAFHNAYSGSISSVFSKLKSIDQSAYKNIMDKIANASHKCLSKYIYENYKRSEDANITKRSNTNKRN